MAISVEDGSGIANANSYVTVAEVHAFATARGLTFPNDATGEPFLIRAMDYLETIEWQGQPVYTNGLAWPRNGVYINGALQPNNVIPKAVKTAQMQLAITAQSMDLLPITETGAMVKREKVGPIETEYSESVGLFIGSPVMPLIDSLLSPYLSSNSGAPLNVRVVRV